MGVSTADCHCKGTTPVPATLEYSLCSIEAIMVMAAAASGGSILSITVAAGTIRKLGHVGFEQGHWYAINAS